MKVYALWFGGPSYASPSIPDDVEEFDSIKEAGEFLYDREHSPNLRTPYTPCAENSLMWLFASDPKKKQDPYPDWVLTIGPRGGIQKEKT